MSQAMWRSHSAAGTPMSPSARGVSRPAWSQMNRYGAEAPARRTIAGSSSPSRKSRSPPNHRGRGLTAPRCLGSTSGTSLATAIPHRGGVRRAPSDAAPSRGARPARHRLPAADLSPQPRCATAPTCSATAWVWPAPRALPTQLSFESRVVLEHDPAPLVSDAGEAIAPTGPVFPFAYGAEDMPDLLRLIEPGHCRSHWRSGRLRAPVPPLVRGDAGDLASGRHDPRRARALPLRPALRRAHPGAGGDAGAGLRHLPRLRRADDGGGALARPRRPASSPATSTARPAARVRGPRAAATPTPGRRSTCQAAAGWSSTPPTASSATTTSSRWP